MRSIARSWPRYPRGGPAPTRTVGGHAGRHAPGEPRLLVQRLLGGRRAARRHPLGDRRTAARLACRHARPAQRGGRGGRSGHGRGLGHQQRARHDGRRPAARDALPRRRRADAGWPRCHAGDIPDPDLGDEPDPVHGCRRLRGCRAAGCHLPGARGAAGHRLLGRPRRHRLPRILEPLQQGGIRGALDALGRRAHWARTRSWQAASWTKTAATPAAVRPASSWVPMGPSTSRTTRAASSTASAAA